MPLTLDSPNQTRHQLPSTSLDSSQSPSQISSGGGASSTSSLVSPIGSSLRSPLSPLTHSFAYGSADTGTGGLKSPQPSFDVSHIAVQGSTPSFSPLRGIKDAYLARPWQKGGLAEEPLLEEPAETEGDVEEDQGEMKGDAFETGRKDTEEEKVVQNGRVIALDFDDVCCQYIPTLAAEHNAKFGTNLTVEDFKTYMFFQNRGWGTPAETQRKLAKLDTALPQTAAVPGFATALRALKALGHPLHIVTARPEPFKPNIEEWLAMHGIPVGTGEGDVVAAVWCCSSYTKEPLPEARDTASGIEEEKALNERLLGLFGNGKSGTSKLRILRAINASLFIDDHHGNLEPIISSDPPIPCLLFGDYPWNRSRSGVTTPGEMMSFDERTKAGLEITVEDIEMGLHLTRVKGWQDVIGWVKAWDRAAAEEHEQ